MADSKLGETSVEEEEKKKKQVLLVMNHVTINMAVSILNFTTRGEMLKDLVGGDYAKVGSYLSTWTGITALAEFMLNPTIGRLSDTYGRKPFMMLSPYAAIVLKAWVLWKPSILSLTVERIVCDGLRTLSGTTMGSAALTDLVPGNELGKAFSRMYSFMGIAIIASPLVASRLSARGTYKAAIALAFVQLFTDQFMLQETLPESARKPFGGVSNPFSLLRMFTATKELTTATSVMALHNMMDMKIMADPLIVLQLSVLKWARETTQQFTSVLGLGLLVGRKITAKSVDALGPHGHTTLCHITTICSNLLLGFFPNSYTMVVAGFAGWIGDQKPHCIKQMATNLALKTGKFGKGELSGLQANLRALCVSIGPFVYAAAYARGLKVGKPGAAFIAAAVVCSAAELMHQRLIGKVNSE